MNKSLVVGAVLGGASVLSLGGYAGYRAMSGPAYADVVSVEPVKQAVTTPKEECRTEQVTRRKDVKDEHQIVGTVIGGVVGGVVGHQVGEGRGKDLATVAGAVGGGYAGNRVQKHMQDNDTYTTQERRCKTVNVASEKVIAYDVKYLLDGHVGKVRMESKPGDRLPVKNGKVVLNEVDKGARAN
jgi:uncharacterized protein YcfJ